MTCIDDNPPTEECSASQEAHDMVNLLSMCQLHLMPTPEGKYIGRLIDMTLRRREKRIQALVEARKREHA